MYSSYRLLNIFSHFLLQKSNTFLASRQIIKMINFSPQKIVFFGFFLIFFIITVIGKNVVIRVSQLFWKSAHPIFQYQWIIPQNVSYWDTLQMT